MASAIMSSQSMILTTAMAVSGAVIFVSLCRIRNLPTLSHHFNSHSSNHLPPSLRSCLSSGNSCNVLKDGKRQEKYKKKKVKFADNVKDERSKAKNKKISKRREIYTNSNENIPDFHRFSTNRAALYHGILRDRVHRIGCSY